MMTGVAVHSVVKIYACAIGWEGSSIRVSSEFDVAVEVEDIESAWDVVKMGGFVLDAVPHDGQG
jgi:hypothetical protein